MKKVQYSSFKFNPIFPSFVLALASLLGANQTSANQGWGTNTDIAGNPINVPTYYANSPQGIQPAFDLTNHVYAASGVVDTGVPLRKFVDPLAGVLTPASLAAQAAATASGVAPTGGAGIPLAIASKWLNPLTNVQTKDDYYEIAIVAYKQNMHSDLMDYDPLTGLPTVKHNTQLRGYVQIETSAIAGGLLKDATGAVSEHIALTYPNGTPILDALGNQVFGVHQPHYLGPIIVATRGTAVRIKYTNFLPFGVDPVTGNNLGDLPLPVDEFIAGGGPAVDKTGKPVKFTQNRADIHWHGGDTPWISDGTPHQWVAPAGETLAYSVGIGKGASAQNVPDMPDPGTGAGTLYFPNNLSARLMFYHDHTSGLTKLNVYEGIAAGYVVVDPIEQGLVTSGVLPNTLLGVGIPLVIQDKTFVPKNIGPVGGVAGGVTVAQSQDTRWDLTHWGQPGDLWFPHVYETNQDPNSIDGTNPVGRWDWGPWFWPIYPSQYSLPTGAYGDVSATPEAFMDTPTVNGQAYPTMTVDPTAYRFRILSVPNDRTNNLNLFEAVDANGVICDSNPASATYVATPALPGSLQPTAASGVVAATAGNGYGPTGALTMAPGGTATPAACTELRMVSAAQTAGFPTWWPTDGRNGGVPDPATAGPAILQIGNEAGFLPALATWNPQPVYYEQNVRRMTLFNILKHGLLMGPAERADVVIDFSQYAGKTLILYNDAPAPMPGFDPRIDYFTGGGDQTLGGGAYNTLPGYGPNTRTIMQFKVNAVNTPVAGVSPPIVQFNAAGLASALPVAYAASQPAPLIPESAYNTALGTNNTDHYAQIYTGASSQPNFQWNTNGTQTVTGVTVVDGGIGFTSVPTVVFSGGGGTTQATATATINTALQTVTAINMLTPGVGYTSAPTITLVGGGGYAATLTVQTTATQSLPIISKAIQELFEPVYGRMNATLAVELHLSNATTATTVPLAYIDTPVDSIDGIQDGQTQIWKITHNGVDSHPVHFHLVNVQVLNRVDWAGVVKPPEANEIGWKETLRMNPLEDVFVALKAVHPVTPFGLPQSSRPLDPTQVLGSQLGFTQIDPTTGLAPAVPYSNVVYNFDNEYVWHCHILGHEENDFMRPFVFHPTVTVPDAPGALAFNTTTNTLTWNDPTPFGGVDAWGVPTAGVVAGGSTIPSSNPKNEVGFTIQRTVAGKSTLAASLRANVTSWIDPSPVAGATYQVVAYNAAGNSASASTAPVALGLKGVVAFTTTTPPVSIADTKVTLTWNAFTTPVTKPTATTITGYNVYRNGVLLTTGSLTIAGTLSSPLTYLTTRTYIDTPVNEGSTYSYQIKAVGHQGNALSKELPLAQQLPSVPSITVSAPSSIPKVPTSLSVSVSATGPLSPIATLTWVDNAFNETGYIVQRQTGTTCTAAGAWIALATLPAKSTSYIDNTGTAFTSTYCYRVGAINSVATIPSAWLMTPSGISMAAAATSVVAAIPTAPTGLTQSLNATTGIVTFTWNAVAGATGYIVTVNGASTLVTTNSYAPATALALGSTVTVASVITTGATSVTSASASIYNGAALPPVAFTAAPGTNTGSVTLTWANNPLNVNNLANFLVSWATGTAAAVSSSFLPTSTGATVVGLTSGLTYTFTIQAVEPTGSIGPSTILTTTAVAK